MSANSGRLRLLTKLRSLPFRTLGLGPPQCPVRPEPAVAALFVAQRLWADEIGGMPGQSSGCGAITHLDAVVLGGILVGPLPGKAPFPSDAAAHTKLPSGRGARLAAGHRRVPPTEVRRLDLYPPTVPTIDARHWRNRPGI